MEDQKSVKTGIAINKFSFMRVIEEALQLWWTMQKRGQEELPLAQGQGQQLRVPGWQHRSGLEELPHFQGAVAVWVQEGQEELLHVQGEEGRRYPLSKVRSSGCTLLEKLQRDTPRPR